MPILLPALIKNAGQRAVDCYVTFYEANLIDPYTRFVYAQCVGDFLAWLEGAGVGSIADALAVHVSNYLETLGRQESAPSTKQRLAAIRRLFDWLTTGGILPFNPATLVRVPKHPAQVGKMPVLNPTEARQLLDYIDTSTPIGLRDRALIGLMVYCFGRIGAAIGMKVGDVFTRDSRLWVRVHEQGSKQLEMRCHHTLEAYLRAYIDGCCLAEDLRGPLFRTIRRGTSQLSSTPLPSSNAFSMVSRRAKTVGVETRIGRRKRRAFRPDAG